MRCVRNEHASTISTSTSTWNWIKCVSATVHVCCVCCRAKSTPIFRLFEGRDSTRLDSIQHSHEHCNFESDSFSARCRATAGGNGRIVFFGFVVWFYRLMVCQLFTHFILFPFDDNGQRCGEWETTLLIYLMESAGRFFLLSPFLCVPCSQ